MAQWIQRMVSAMVLMVFIASIIPTALAEREDEQNEQREEQQGFRIEVTQVTEDTLETGRATEQEREEESQGTGRNARAVLEQERNEVLEDIRKERKEIKEELQEARTEARNAGEKFSTEGKAFVKEQMKELREKYTNLKEEYKQKRDEYQNYRHELKEKHKQAKECDEESTECTEKKFELKRGVQQHLFKTIELIDRSLEKLTNRVESSEKLTEEEKQDALQKISTLEVKLTGTKERVDAMSGNTTNAELRVAIRDLKNVWQEVRKEQRRIIASLMSSKQEIVLEKHDESSSGMEEKIGKLRAEGKDVSTLAEIHLRFVDELEKLKEIVAIAREKWQEAKEGKESFEAWKSAEKDVQAQMKKTKEVLREFTKEYKRLTGKITIAAETEETAGVSSESSETTASGEVTVE